MNNIFLWYPKCTTCQKAKKWLEENKICFEERNIVDNKPNKQELEKWIEKSGYEIKRFFNTSGLKYRDLNLKEKLPQMSDSEKIELLATDGMLVKRPIFISNNNILIGFKENEWKNINNK